ncbi:MAG: hypothetical protein KKA42_00725 [candidate division Zixibacteria bacterium]|nr:hypothetical protein [candidate division Zixibacteria bacterium]
MNGLQNITARRAWLVPSFAVWGTQPAGEQEFLCCTTIDGVDSIHYGATSFGETEQEVLFQDLRDHRGNYLPETIKSPAVILRPRNSGSVFVVGRESRDRFKIAHDAAVSSPVSVDLLIIEMGD